MKHEDKIEFEEWKATTHQLRCVWPRLQKPSFKFKDEGEFNIGLLLHPEDERDQAFLEQVQEMQRAAVLRYIQETGKKNPKVAEPPFRPYLDKDGNDTGMVKITFKKPAAYTDRKTKEVTINRIPLFNAAGQPITEDINLGGGSLVKVRFSIRGFFTSLVGVGLSCRLTAVQVIEAKTAYDVNDPTTFGFSAEEAGDEDSFDPVEDVRTAAPSTGKMKRSGDF